MMEHISCAFRNHVSDHQIIQTAVTEAEKSDGSMKVYEFGTEHERKNDLAYTQRIYPQAVPKEFEGLAHAELVLMFPERFFAEVKRFMDEEE